MSAPLIWIVAPLVLSIVAFVIKNERLFIIISVGSFCAFLSILALTVKIDTIFSLGPLKVEIGSSLAILGRAFILSDGDRYLIALLYGLAAAWIFGSRITATNYFFVPLALAIIALLIAAISVEPFLYAALIIELAVLVSIPVLVQQENKIGIGIYRYLIFQTLAVPFILIAGWGFEQAIVSADAQRIYLFSAALLGFGFALWLAVFPFYTWIPLLAESAHSFTAGFIFAVIPTTAQLLLVDFFNNYSWLRNDVLINSVSQIAGVLMIVIPGLWSIYQKSIMRLFGYLILVEIGFAILAFSTNTHLGWEVYFSALLPRILAIALCSMAISMWKSQGVSLNMDLMKSIFFTRPISVGAFLIGWFSLSGVPLFSMFSIRLALLTQISEKSLAIAIWPIIGIFGLFFASFRIISVFFSSTSRKEIQISETPLQIIFLGVGSILLLIMGLVPNLFTNIFLQVLSIYTNLP